MCIFLYISHLQWHNLWTWQNTVWVGLLLCILTSPSKPEAVCGRDKFTSGRVVILIRLQHEGLGAAASITVCLLRLLEVLDRDTHSAAPSSQDPMTHWTSPAQIRRLHTVQSRSLLESRPQREAVGGVDVCFSARFRVERRENYVLYKMINNVSDFYKHGSNYTTHLLKGRSTNFYTSGSVSLCCMSFPSLSFSLSICFSSPLSCPLSIQRLLASVYANWDPNTHSWCITLLLLLLSAVLFDGCCYQVAQSHIWLDKCTYRLRLQGDSSK